MFDIRRSVVAQLVLGYGILVTSSIAVVALVFYYGTLGMLQQKIDNRVVSILNHEVALYDHQPQDKLVSEINHQLNDSVNTDTEIFQLLTPHGQPIVGNLEQWTPLIAGQFKTERVLRQGKPALARLLSHRLGNQDTLIVGWELSEQISIGLLVWRSLLVGALMAIGMVFGGAILFRRQIERRIGDIRQTTLQIEAGHLNRRIPISSQDEFGRLSQDINRMLDRIEQLMDGVRHVSNAIAHDLRTPLSRIRTRLDASIRQDPTADSLPMAAATAITDIDELMQVFEKLLQIAEAESGVHGNAFEPINMNAVAQDMADLYDARAEVAAVTLTTRLLQPAWVLGDKNLLANALASLVDNAIKYVGQSGWVEIHTIVEPNQILLEVVDSGPGIPEAELGKVTTRFYRVDQSRHLPGNGLGLSIVNAIASLHGGQLVLVNCYPGLLARIILPRCLMQ